MLAISIHKTTLADSASRGPEVPFCQHSVVDYGLREDIYVFLRFSKQGADKAFSKTGQVFFSHVKPTSSLSKTLKTLFHYKVNRELSQKDMFFLFFQQFLGTFDLALYYHVSINIFLWDMMRTME